MAEGRRRAGETRRRPQGDISRTRLLDAGIEVFAALSRRELLSGIGPRRVVAHLGDVSPGAFYHHFPGQAAYLEELVAHALAPPRDEIGPDLAGLLFEIGAHPDADVLGHLRRALTRNFERQCTTGLTGLQFQLCLWAKPDGPAAAVLRAGYERLHDNLAPAYELVLERWGREFRPPFTPRTVTAVFAALLEGLAVHHTVDPHTVTPELFAQSVAALLPTMTRPVGDDADLDEAVEPIARFARAPRAAVTDPDARRRLLDTTVARADAGEFTATTVDELAAAADAPVDVIYTEFRGKPGLAAAAFARYLPMLERPLVAELESGAAPLDVVRSHLVRLADVAARHRGLTSAFFDAIQAATLRYGSEVGANDLRALVPLPQLLAPVLRAGQEQGVVREDFDGAELAGLITNLALVRVITCPDESARQTAEIVSELALFGVSRPV